MWRNRVVACHHADLANRHYSELSLTTVPLSLPKLVLHRGRSSAFSFHYIVIFLRPCNSCLYLRPSHLVTSILSTIFSSLTLMIEMDLGSIRAGLTRGVSSTAMWNANRETNTCYFPGYYFSKYGDKLQLPS